ncbi:hypothetical protein [Flavisolibacter ginsenosidimutans]|uniref:Uncharacterized protein n=1 Tax=Flavisolibacter ginsenosidimutans TaxID=661481 RepID=A0A5B8UM04_9BACT|nr:hypothetical protein [Flavisolibacter ginsenosidimutans]QEC57687.1 hypothetical protein FSB75_17850 [Flavisolibacter ginsenosidimutans]
MKKILLASGLIALSVLTYSFTTAGKSHAVKANAVTHIDVDIPISFTTTFNDLCTGELVDLTYNGTLSIHGVINNNRVNVSTQENIQLSGVGETSGATYVGHVTQNSTQNGSLNNSQFVFNDIVNANLNTAGGGNNVKESTAFHVTVNADGTVSVIRSEPFNQVCQ